MAPLKKTGGFSRAESIAFCGLAIALLAVSAWITVPFGPVPFTLQTMVLVFVVLLFPPRQALASIFGYLILGALGAPVFSGMKGGMASLLGTSGGFIIGFGLGAVAAVTILKVWKVPAEAKGKSASEGVGRSKRVHVISLAREFVAAFVLLLISYLCGWAQLMAVAGLGPFAAFVAGIAPFIIIDVIKVVVGASLARVIRQALPALRTQAA